VTKELEDWRASKKAPIDYSSDPMVARLLEAAEDGELIEIVYHGGSSPGSSRWISPRKLFRVAGYGIYVEAYCDQRKEVRTFSTDKIGIAHEDDPRQLSAGDLISTSRDASSRLASSSKASDATWIYWVVGIGLLLLAIFW
jgi:predicted DNA-binding transcriptional regulator YafY